MSRSRWAMTRAATLGLGLVFGRLIIEYILMPHPSDKVLTNVTIAFCTGFLIGLPLWYARFPMNKKEIEKNNEQDLGQ